MNNDGAATPRPTLSVPRREDAASPGPGPSTPAAPLTVDAVVRAIDALLVMAVGLAAPDVLRRLALVVGSADWHLVASAEHVAGTWLGLRARKAVVWAEVSPRTLPALGMVAVNDPAALAGLSHDRPWDVHAVTLGELREAVTAARGERRAQIRVTLVSSGELDELPPTQSVTLSVIVLGEVLDALEAFGDPPRPVWAYLRDDDGHRVLVLDGGAWLAELDDDCDRPLLVGKAAVPWPLRLAEVTSTLGPGLTPVALLRREAR